MFVVLSYFSWNYVIVGNMHIRYSYDIVKQIWYFGQMRGIFVFWFVIFVFFLIGVCLFVCVCVCVCMFVCIAADSVIDLQAVEWALQ